MNAEQSGADSPNVPWPDIVKFIRQLGHDIRNNLNAVELQSAYLAELAEGNELKGEVRRLREMVSQIGTSLQKLSSGLGQAISSRISYPATDFIEDLKQKLAKDFADQASKITWDVQLNDEKLAIDPLLAQHALVELFANAFHHERIVKQIVAKVYVANGKFNFELREPKAKFDMPTKNWGREPLRYVGQGRYGLGLNRVRMIVEAHHGTFGADYDRSTSTLVTTICLPISH